MNSFINEKKIQDLLKGKESNADKTRNIIKKSLLKQRLDLDEVAILLNTEDPKLIQEIFNGAKKLKEDIYGNRIVLFAPLYIGNDCTNDCQYCAFRTSNKEARRRTLSDSELNKEVEILESKGHKRLILVYGEHPKYDADFIAKTVKTTYSVKSDRGLPAGRQGEIRRVNINAPPLEVEGFKKVKEAGIGTYQIFQETYHQETYKKYHPRGKKSDYFWRLNGLDRAQEAGIDDVGIGVLFGLYDWKFEVMGLVAHAIHLEEKYNVGPHTISFPRLQPAQGVNLEPKYLVSDDEFKRLVAILRLAVPYTGLILTARENPKIRKEVVDLGCSQIDAGSRIELGGYTDSRSDQEIDRQQFKLGDTRSLDEVMRGLLEDGYTPSFCTSCYRLGRTGEHFMEFAIPGFIHEYCTPNALLTLKEYLEDYASEETKKTGEIAIQSVLNKLKNPKIKKRIQERLARIEKGERDLYC